MRCGRYPTTPLTSPGEPCKGSDVITTTPPIYIVYDDATACDATAVTVSVDGDVVWGEVIYAEVVETVRPPIRLGTIFSQAAASDRGTDDPSINAAWVAAMAEVALSCDSSVPDGVRRPLLGGCLAAAMFES